MHTYELMNELKCTYGAHNRIHTRTLTHTRTHERTHARTHTCACVYVRVCVCCVCVCPQRVRTQCMHLFFLLFFLPWHRVA